MQVREPPGPVRPGWLRSRNRSPLQARTPPVSRPALRAAASAEAARARAAPGRAAGPGRVVVHRRSPAARRRATGPGAAHRRAAAQEPAVRRRFVAVRRRAVAPTGRARPPSAAPMAHAPVQVARAASEDRARPRPPLRTRHHDRARPAPPDPPRPRPSRSGRRDCRPRWSTRCPRRFRRTACATSRPRGRRASPPADSCPYCPPHGPYENGSSGKRGPPGDTTPHGKDARRTGSGVTPVSAPRMRRRWSGRRSCRWRPSVPSSA